MCQEIVKDNKKRLQGYMIVLVMVAVFHQNCNQGTYGMRP